MDKKVYNTGETEEELKAEYNYEGSNLRKAQDRMLELLIFLDKVCTENDIDYFIGYGTLLGAVRHGGFIPWDDDTDVVMSPAGLKKFRKVVNSGKYDYVVQDHSIDKGFVRHYNVLRDLNSCYIKDEFIHNQRKYKGVQVDIFPWGFGVKKKPRAFIKRLQVINEWHALGKHPIISSMIYGISKYFFIPVFKFFSLFSSKEYLYLGYENEWDLKYKYDDIFPLGRIEFEGHQLKCPHNPKGMLLVDYGSNYNDLPPKESRNHHSVDTIEFYN